MRRPRLKYSSGVPVTFGGKVCTELLSSSGWQPQTTMLVVFQEIREALTRAGAEVDQTVSKLKVDEAYAGAQPEINRLRTTAFKPANDFLKDRMLVISPQEASPFIGDLLRLEATDKIGLPFKFAEEIYGRAQRNLSLDLPLMFEIKTRLGRKTHCSIFDFIQGLPDDCCLLPKWLMDDLFMEERDTVRVRCIKMDLITYVKVQPHSVEFYAAVQRSGQEVGPLLTASLSRFSALTEDSNYPVQIGDETFQVMIVALKPSGAVRIIDQDVQHSFEFQVDFDPAPDLEDEAEKAARHEELMAHWKERRASAEQGKKSHEEQIEAAKRQRVAKKGEQAAMLAGGADGTTGDIEISLRFPNGTSTKAKFPADTPVAAVCALVWRDPWAEAACPWGIQLMIPFPRRMLSPKDAITKDMHRSIISIREEQAPDDVEEILAADVASEAEASVPSHQIPPIPVPELNEEEAQRRTERAFEIQRFIQAGMEVEEAERRYNAGDRQPLSQGALADRPPPPVPVAQRPMAQVAPAAPAPAAPAAPDDAERARHLQSTETVMAFTGTDHDQAYQALARHNWDLQKAIDELLDPPAEAPAQPAPARPATNHDAEIEQVMAITKFADRGLVRDILEANSWDSQRAVKVVLEMNRHGAAGGGGGGGGGPGAAVGDAGARSGAAQQKKAIKEVMDVTGLTRERVLRELEFVQWDTERAIDRLLEAI